MLVEYAKQSPTDILIQISVCNRGPDAPSVHVLPTLWFRNVWTWWPEIPKPSLRAVTTGNGIAAIGAFDAQLGDYFLYCDGAPPLLFTDNDTNNQRCFGSSSAGPYVKDGINDFVVAGVRKPSIRSKRGPRRPHTTRWASRQTAVVRLRLTNIAPDAIGDPFGLQAMIEQCLAHGFDCGRQVLLSKRVDGDLCAGSHDVRPLHETIGSSPACANGRQRRVDLRQAPASYVSQSWMLVRLPACSRGS